MKRRIYKYLFYSYDNHPYLFSFIFAIILISYSLFYSPDIETSEDKFTFNENIIIVDIDKIRFHKRIVKKDYSLDEGRSVTNIKMVERAVGTSDDIDAVDMDFIPDLSNLVTPRPLGKLKRLYPKIATERNIEAELNLEILYSKDGIVRNVRVLGIKLSKSLPASLQNEIEEQFIRDVKKILIGHQFSPPIYKGSRIPLKMPTTFQFRLED